MDVSIVSTSLVRELIDHHFLTPLATGMRGLHATEAAGQETEVGFLRTAQCDRARTTRCCRRWMGWITLPVIMWLLASRRVSVVDVCGTSVLVADRSEGRAPGGRSVFCCSSCLQGLVRSQTAERGRGREQRETKGGCYSDVSTEHVAVRSCYLVRRDRAKKARPVGISHASFVPAHTHVSLEKLATPSAGEGAVRAQVPNRCRCQGPLLHFQQHSCR